MKYGIQNFLLNGSRKAMPILTYPGLELTGKTVTDLVTNGEDQAGCIIALAEKFNAAASVMVMDLSVEAQAFGSSVKFDSIEVPAIKNRLLHNQEDINRLVVPQVGNFRTAEFIKAASIAASQIKDRPVFGGIIGPYSLACRLFDITEMMMFVLMEPESAQQLLHKCTSFLVDYALEFKKAGAGGIIIAEPAAGLLDEYTCHEFSSHYVKQIVNAVQDENFIVILHNCGNTVTLVNTMVSTQAAGLHFGNAVDFREILPQVPSTIPVLGNLDPAGIFKMGTQEMVREKTLDMLSSYCSYANYIPSSGCDIPPGTPLGNVEAFFDAVESFRSSP